MQHCRAQRSIKSYHQEAAIPISLSATAIRTILNEDVGQFKKFVRCDVLSMHLYAVVVDVSKAGENGFCSCRSEPKIL